MKKCSVILSFIILLSAFAPVVSAEEWIPVNMTRELTYDRGIIGGEGCQYAGSIATCQADPNFMMYATDVGGVYRSYNAGELWEPCNVGFTARGASEILIDPKNPDHVILYNCNATPQSYNGLLLSMDGGDSWQKVLPFQAAAPTDSRDQFAFDPTSYDEKTGMCMRMFWSTPSDQMSRHLSASKNTPEVLYVSEDAGLTWNAVPNSSHLWDADLDFSDIGELYVGSPGGFYVSSDGGKTFTKTLDEWVLSVDYVSITPEKVYLSTWHNIYISNDRGRTFQKLEGDKMPPVYAGEPNSNTRWMGYRYFNVSPLNPNHMVIGAGLSEYNWQRWYSRDGGKTWYKGYVEYLENQTHYSTRNCHNEWSLLDEDTVYSTGGDWLTRSTNGGATYRWYSQGINAFMSVGIKINHTNPDMMFIHGKDYGAFASYDGGETWSFADVHNEGRGADIHDGWVVDDNFAFGIGARDSSEWFRPKPNSRKQELKIARGYHNLGFRPTGLDPETFFCYQSYNNPDVLFAGVLRSDDRGETWQKMTGCRGVITHNSDPNGAHELYGFNDSTIVVSYDEGITWQKVCTLSFTPDSMAYNWKQGQLFATKYDLNQLHRINVKTGSVSEVSAGMTPSIIGVRCYSVAVDPVDPDIVYVAGPCNYAFSDVSVQRSLDGGNTWEVLTRHSPEASVIKTGFEGPAEANYVLVHPITRELWVTTQCFGTWKIGAPGSTEKIGYLAHEKLYAGQKENGVYLNWYGNGKYDLKNVAHMSSLSDLYKPHDEWAETVYEAIFVNDTMITDAEIDTVAWYAFQEWENPVYVYDVMKSTDGVNFEVIKTTNLTDFTDSDVESGNTYYYKVVNTYTNQTTVTKTVSVK